MSDEYTPTTGEVRMVWIRLGGDAARFDRWLASVKAEVWDEALSAADSFIGNASDAPNPYEEA